MPVEIEQPSLVSRRASVVGDVKISRRCSIWPFASLRADVGTIIIGEGTSVQDCCVVHCDPGRTATIGSNVTIGHGAIVHGCTIGDEVMIGMNAVVLDGAEVGGGSIVGAGAVVTEGMVILEGSLVLGVPARIVRSGDPGLRERARENALSYQRLVEEYLNGDRGPI